MRFRARRPSVAFELGEFPLRKCGRLLYVKSPSDTAISFSERVRSFVTTRFLGCFRFGNRHREVFDAGHTRDRPRAGTVRRKGVADVRSRSTPAIALEPARPRLGIASGCVEAKARQRGAGNHAGHIRDGSRARARVLTVPIVRCSDFWLAASQGLEP